MDQIEALGTTHKIHGILQTTKKRSAEIKLFPTPRELRDVQSFLATIGICRRFIKNFSELSRPLSRLSKKNVPFHIGDSEILSFTVLRHLASEVVESHGPDPFEPCEMYTDTSKYGIGCVITQRQKIDTQSTKKSNVPLIFDSMLLSKTQMNYGTYKRELFAMVHFGTKYAHMFRIHDKISTFHTDHKPLVHFIHSPYSEGIYA